MSESELRKTIIDLERALESEQTQLRSMRRVALRALAVVAARVPALEGAVHDLTRAIEDDPDDTQWLDRLSAQLADAIRASDQRQDLAEGILETVQRGLTGFAFLDTELDALVRANDRLDLPEIQRTLGRLFLVLHEQCDQAISEREELTEVVGEIWNRLEDVDSALSEDESRGQRARDAISTLQNDISDDVQHLKGRVIDISDIQLLRREVTKGLDAVVDRVTTFRDTQEAELLSALERNRALRAKGQQLESQVQGLQQRLEQARAEAVRDSLTGLANRQAFTQEFAELTGHLRAGNAATLVVWDIDHFKAINDEYGHSSGDKVLKAVAEILADGVREPDFVGRYGGEEFVMILYQDLDAARERAEATRQQVRELIVRAGTTRLQVTISAGLAPAAPGSDPQRAFDAADHALLQAKKCGRDRIEIAAE
ncbi:MAG: diguanylate cyclase [Pseudomonadota bacterium]